MATIPRTAPRRHRLTVSDFHRMGEAGIFAAGDRVELIDGEVIDMSPIGALHAAIVARLTAFLCRSVGSGVIVWCQNPIRLDEASEPEPDIALLRPRATAAGAQANARGSPCDANPHPALRRVRGPRCGAARVPG